MVNHELLKELSEAHAAPGDEGAVREIFLREVGGLGAVQPDGLGGVQVSLSAQQAEESSEALPRVMLTAHMDEVGFMVQATLPDGSLEVVGLGGWWTHTLLSQRIKLKARGGAEILGVFAAASVHQLSGDAAKQVVPIERLRLDIGASCTADVEALGVSVGDILTPMSSYEPLAVAHRYLGKALDNRLGMGALIEVGKRLGRQAAPNQTLLVATAQEELGTRGAALATRLAKPDVAIVFECAPADDLPRTASSAQGVLGQGVQIRLFDPTMVASRSLLELTREVAEAQQIPHQLAVRRTGGTDAKDIHLSEQGIPTIVISTPARAIHTHNAIFDERDFAAQCDLAEALMRALDAQRVQELVAM